MSTINYDETIKLGVHLDLTADPWSRKVRYHDDFIGHLHFHPDHDHGEFRLELGPNLPLRLELAVAILAKAQEDQSIWYQQEQDKKRTT